MGLHLSLRSGPLLVPAGWRMLLHRLASSGVHPHSTPTTPRPVPQLIIGPVFPPTGCPQVVLAEKQQCPFTNQPLQFEQLKVRAGRGWRWC